MQEVPKIVRARLRTATAAVNHPDADVLTAFSEQSLGDADRSIVLEHLARCGECRDVVALALPEMEAAQVMVRPTADSSRGWLAWPAMRWAFVAAGILAIASFGVVRYEKLMRPATAYENLPAGPVGMEAKSMPPAVANSSEPANAQAAASSSAQSASPKPTLASNAPQREASPAPPATFVPNRHGARDAQPFERNGIQVTGPVPPPFSKQRPGNAAVPAPSETARVEAPAVAPALNSESSEIRVDRAKSADGVQDALASAQPRWTISPTGVLQRSMDQGKTWQYVYVGPGYTTEPASANGVRNSLAKAASPSTSTAFAVRAFASNGTEVWAGGSGGMLYHSTDSGNSWSRVMPTASDAGLTGDVVTVEFADAQHGRVVTSTSETWTTADDGLTWQKQ
jgi:hypothetical protein